MSGLMAWFYDEFQQTGLDFEDSAQVEAYDHNQGSSTEADQGLIECLGIARDDTLIDLGSGTGAFAIQAAQTCAQVYAVDVSPAMLNYARQKANANGLTNIEFHRGGFLTYEHQAKTVDFIVTKYALHHLPDFWKMIALLRMGAMLKTGGILYLRDVIFSFDPAEYQTRVAAWINRMARPTGEGFTASDFEMHVREEYSTFSWVLEGMLSRAGFEIIAADYFAPEYAQYICKMVDR